MNITVKNGIDNLKLHADVLRHRRLGLITNPSGVDLQMRSTIDLLASEFRLTALFGPEHGVRGNFQNGEHFDDYTDPATGVPVQSLYGSSEHLSPERLAEVDMVVFDLQDAGSRPFSYLRTLAYVLEDCAAAGKAVTVLDRVNPIGGAAEGIMPELLSCKRCWGREIPLRFGLTVGEYARWINFKQLDNACDLTVIPCADYRRDCFASECGLQWINPSPNLPNEIAALLYAGCCMFGQTNVSEARGTTRPYEFYGAPWIDGEKLARRMNARALPGVIFRPAAFTAGDNAFNKYEHELCFGVQVHVLEKHAVNSFELGMWLIDTIREDYPEFAIPFANGRCSAETFDSVVGTSSWRAGRESTAALLARGRRESAEFVNSVREFLLYPFSN